MIKLRMKVDDVARPAKVTVSQEKHNADLELLKSLKAKRNEEKLDFINCQKNGEFINDNYSLNNARAALKTLDDNILSLETAIKNQVISDIVEDDNQINIDNFVNLEYENGDSIKIKLIQSFSGQILVGGIQQVSLESPIGKAIYKKHVGDTVSFSMGSKTSTVKILSKEN